MPEIDDCQHRVKTLPMNQTEFVRQMSHADVLISQGLFDRAEAILEKLMATGIESNIIVRMMAMTKLGLSKYSEAEELCRMILSRSPDEAFVFYMLANIRATERQFSEALQYLKEAIRIEPANADFHAFKAHILLQTKEFDLALGAADRGLNIDAENISALNARASALVGLGRNDEAYETIEKSLASDPNNADTHANLGWGLLHKGKSEQALIHFKEALRENPLNEYARSGMLEAMKARFPVYRYFLVMMLWLGKMKGRNQWIIVIAAFVIYRILVTAAKKFDALQPLLIPILLIISLVFISTWIFSPIMNLYLLSNTYGKYTITPDQKLSARLVGIALVISILSLILYFSGVENDGLLSFSLWSFAMMIPLGSMNNPLLDVNRRKLRLATICTGIMVGLDSSLAVWLGTFMSQFFFLPALSLLAYQWFANYIIIKE